MRDIKKKKFKKEDIVFKVDDPLQGYVIPYGARYDTFGEVEYEI